MNWLLSVSNCPLFWTLHCFQPLQWCFKVWQTLYICSIDIQVQQANPWFLKLSFCTENASTSYGLGAWYWHFILYALVIELLDLHDAFAPVIQNINNYMIFGLYIRWSGKRVILEFMLLEIETYYRFFFDWWRVFILSYIWKEEYDLCLLGAVCWALIPDWAVGYLQNLWWTLCTFPSYFDTVL